VCVRGKVSAGESVAILTAMVFEHVSHYGS
jgi:hypothetical protein